MDSSKRRGILLPALVIGTGLGGFFDGILLHQVLQWHHLLSLVPGEAFRDIGTQILADGLFHVLMYIVTAAGLWLLWRRRYALETSGWRRVAGGGLLGFGIWNVIDVAFFHWVLGIHRIRVDVPDPMAYDLGWIALLGGVPLVLAWLLLRRGGSAGSGGATSGTRAAATLSLLALLAAPLAALPQASSSSALVLFAPGSTASIAVNAASAARAPILWIDPDGRMMAVSLEAPGAGARLYANGALLVTRSPALAGCAAAIQS